MADGKKDDVTTAMSIAGEPTWHPKTPTAIEIQSRSDPRAIRKSIISPESNGNEVQLKSGARRLLSALAQWFPEGMTPGQLRAHAGLRKSGTYDAYISNLRTAGFMRQEGGLLYATESGRDRIGSAADDAPSNTEDVLKIWLPKLKKTCRAMLMALVQDGAMSRQDLATKAGITQSGTFDAYLSNLRTARLIKTGGGMVEPDKDTLLLS